MNRRRMSIGWFVLFVENGIIAYRHLKYTIEFTQENFRTIARLWAVNSKLNKDVHSTII